MDAYSGGSHPGAAVNPTAVEAMAEVGVDIADNVPRPWTEETLRAVDVVVTMGCGDECPILPGKRYLDWELTDPAGQPIELVREVRDDIRSLVEKLVSDLMSPFVPPDFDPPLRFDGTGYHLEPLGPEHNERDHAAWMSSIDHIRSTPGLVDWDWPYPMSLDENLADLERHALDFAERIGFTYSILDVDQVIGCLYIYPARDEPGRTSVRSWVTAERAPLDAIVWREISDWLAEVWPFANVRYASRT